MLELMKPLLYGNNDNHSITKCFFLPIVEKKCTKKYPISNAF